MKRFLMLAVVVAALATMGSTVEAGHRSHRGHRNYNWNSGHGYNGRYVSRHSFGHRIHQYPQVHRTWHDTSHLDYHPGQYVPHGNHFDYQPGHYDVHRTGHWDTHLHH